MHETYRLVVVLEGDFFVCLCECVHRSVIPCNIIDPVGLVVVPIKKKRYQENTDKYIVDNPFQAQYYKYAH